MMSARDVERITMVRDVAFVVLTALKLRSRLLGGDSVETLVDEIETRWRAYWGID